MLAGKMPRPSRCFSTSQVITLIGRLASNRWSFPDFSQKSTTGLVCSLNTFSLFAMDYSLSSDLPLVFPLSSSLRLSSSQVHSKQITDLRLTHFDISCYQTSMFYCPLGNPSRRYLPPKLQLQIFQRISLTMRLLEISFPSFIMVLSYCPRGDPVLTSSRSRSPVDKWMKLYFLTSTSHWLSYQKQYVPLPEPGPPRTNRSSAGFGGRMCAAVSLSFNQAQTSSRLLVASTVIQLCLSSKLLTIGFVSAQKVQILFFMVSGLSSALPLVLLRSVMRSIRT